MAEIYIPPLSPLPFSAILFDDYTPVNHNTSCFAGDTLEVPVNVIKGANPVNMTGATSEVEVSTRQGGSSLFMTTLTEVNAAIGKFTIVFPATTTLAWSLSLYYEVECTLGALVKTVQYGTISVTPDTA